MTSIPEKVRAYIANMHTRVFKLIAPEKVTGTQHTGMKAYYTVPTLEAYAIEYAQLRVYQNIDGSGRTELLQGDGFDIEGNSIIWNEYNYIFPGYNTPVYLFIHYHGIRNYIKLFPFIRGDGQKERLAKYYQEAEVNYESGARLSFVLMCGAIFEGMLCDALKEDLKDIGVAKKRNFHNYIKDAFKNELIDEREKDVMHNIREQRNLVHLARYEEPYVSREQAMDTRKVLDDMIIRFSAIPSATDAGKAEK